MKNPFKKNKLGAKVPMRDLTDIQQEYVNLCAQYGSKQYEINVKKEELATLFRQIKDINHEAFEAQKNAPKVADKQPLDEALKDLVAGATPLFRKATRKRRKGNWI